MTVFHGSANHDLKVFKWKLSRYGFPILFCSTDINLAKSYADYWAKEYKKDQGFVYELTIPDSFHEVDFNNQISYCPEFRNLIYQLRKEQRPLVKFQNIIDYPNDSFKTEETKDVIAIYDLDLISGIRKIS